MAHFKCSFCQMVFASVFMAGSWAVGAAPQELLKTQSAWDGGKIAYPKGKPEITSVRLTLLDGKLAPFHCHPVPTLGYVSKGKVRLETEDGKTKEYQAGSSVVEVMKTVHRGESIDGNAEIIVFYAGVEGIPNTILPKQKKLFKEYCQ